MKRLILFLVLVSTGIFVLLLLKEDEDELAPPPPRYDQTANGALTEQPPAPAVEENGLPGDAAGRAGGPKPVARPGGSDPAVADPSAGGPGETSGSGGARQDPQEANASSSESAGDGQGGFLVKDMELTITETYTHEDGRTEEVVAVILGVGYMNQIKGTNLVQADNVSFTFFDLTPDERPVAAGTSDHATLFAEEGSDQSVLDSQLNRNFILRGNVDVKLQATGPVAGETRLLSDLLYFEENRIRSDVDGGPVRIISDRTEIEGLGMEIDLEKRTLTFEKDMTVRGTRFEMPVFQIGAAPPIVEPPAGGEEAASGEEAAGTDEPVTITCGGPFLFKGEQAGEERQAADSLLGSGTLHFAGGVVAFRGERRLVSESLDMVFEKNPAGDLQLKSFEAGSGKEPVCLTSETGRIFCRTLLWRTEPGGTLARLIGDPLIDGVELPAVTGGAVSLYQMSARDEVTVATSDLPDAGGSRISIHLKQDGRIRPAPDAAGPETPDFFMEGDDIRIVLVSTAGEGGEGEAASAPSYSPEELRITGHARVVMDGLFEADEIVMGLQPRRNGALRTVTLSGSALLQREEFRLSAPEIVIFTSPNVATEIVTEQAFTMTISLDGFSGSRGGTSRLAGGEVTATGTKRLRLTWPEKGGGAARQRESNKLEIEGPYAIHVDLGEGENVRMRGSEAFVMGTSLFEGAPLTILDLMGAPHIELTRTRAESMTLDCGQARLELNHATPSPGKKTPEAGRDGLGPALQSGGGSGFFSKSIVKSIEALQDVVLTYGSSRITCATVDWDLTSDLLSADGGDGPVTIETEYGMKISGRRFLLRPDREEMSILEPGAFVIRGQNPPAAVEAAAEERESGGKRP